MVKFAKHSQLKNKLRKVRLLKVIVQLQMLQKIYAWKIIEVTNFSNEDMECI